MYFLRFLFVICFLFTSSAFAAEFPEQVKTSEGVVKGVYDAGYSTVKGWARPMHRLLMAKNAGSCRKKQISIVMHWTAQSLLLLICSLTAKRLSGRKVF